MWCAVERANSLFIMIALGSETKHRRQKEPAQISKHISCPRTEACLFKPSPCACSQLLDLTPNFLMLGGSTWTLLLTLCFPSRMGSSYQSERELHFCVSSTALTPVLKWKSNTGLICQRGMFVQDNTPLIGSTNSPGLSMTLWMTVPYSSYCFFTWPAQLAAFFFPLY